MSEAGRDPAIGALWQMATGGSDVSGGGDGDGPGVDLARRGETSAVANELRFLLDRDSGGRAFVIDALRKIIDGANAEQIAGWMSKMSVVIRA